MSAPDYNNAAQQRVLKMLMLLAGNEFHGVLPGEIAKSMQTSPATTTRDLHNLNAVGFAEQIQETGRWRLSPKIVQISAAFALALERADTQLNQIRNRYTRSL